LRGVRPLKRNPLERTRTRSLTLIAGLSALVDLAERLEVVNAETEKNAERRAI
jgi:hypothetical protein